MITENHSYILNHLLLIQAPVTYSSTCYLLSTCYLFKNLLLIRPWKEAIAVPNITQNAFVYVANNNLEVVVLVNDESELLVYIKLFVTYSKICNLFGRSLAVPWSLFLIRMWSLLVVLVLYSNVKLVICSLFLICYLIRFDLRYCICWCCQQHCWWCCCCCCCRWWERDQSIHFKLIRVLFQKKKHLLSQIPFELHMLMLPTTIAMFLFL